jgi:hypothetical protein
LGIIVKSTKRVPLGELSPYPGNARQGDVDAIEESVRATGVFRAMVVNQRTMQVLTLIGSRYVGFVRGHASRPVKWADG